MSEQTQGQSISRRKVLRGLGAGTLLAIGGPTLLAACRNLEESNGESVTGNGEASNGEASNGNGIELDVAMSSWYFAQEPNNSVFRDVLSDYEAATGASISPSGVDYQEFLNQMLLEARSDRVSGVLHLDFNWLPAMAQLGVLRDLAPAAEGIDYTDAGLRMGAVDGAQLGLPLTTATISMVANVNLLEQAGISELPATVTEFEEALDALKRMDSDMIPYALGTIPTDAKDYIMWMWQFGSEVMSGHDIYLGDEGSVKAMEWTKSLLDEGYIAPDVRRSDSRALFAEERTAFYEDAIVARNNAMEVSGNPSFEEWVVPVPRPRVNPGDDPRALLWGNVMCVADDEHADGATELAKYMTSDPSALAKVHEGIGLPPATDSGLAADAIDEYVRTWTSDVTAYATANPFSAHEEILQLEDELGRAMQEILFGNVSAQDALEQAAERMADVIA